MGAYSRLTIALAALHTTATATALTARQEPDMSNACSPLQIIMARGTLEPATFGKELGGYLFNDTAALVPGLTGYAVVYPANLACDSVATGVNDTINHLTTQAAACPDQKFALVGYSQGADVIYKAAIEVPVALYPRVIAIVQFGDPGNRGVGQLDPLGGVVTGTIPAPLSNRLKENCAYNDLVCTNNGTSLNAHISYYQQNQTYLANSAAFIAKQYASDGNSGSDFSQAANPGNQTQGNIDALLNLGKLLGSKPSSTSQSCPGFTPVPAMAVGSNGTMPSNSSASVTGYASPTMTSSTPPMQTTNAGVALGVNGLGAMAVVGGMLFLA